MSKPKTIDELVQEIIAKLIVNGLIKSNVSKPKTGEYWNKDIESIKHILTKSGLVMPVELKCPDTTCKGKIEYIGRCSKCAMLIDLESYKEQK